MKYLVAALIVMLCVAGLSSMRPAGGSAYSEWTLQQFKTNSVTFAAATAVLKETVTAIQPGDTSSVMDARRALAACRKKYKTIEFFMEYFFQYPVNLYNRPPVYEVEEPYMEYQSPVGLQQIESLLFEDDVYRQKNEIINQADVVNTSAQDIRSILYDLHISDQQVLESIRLELVRIITLGITGYDAPELKTGIAESAAALRTVKENLQPLLATLNGGDSVAYYLQEAIDLLEISTDFDMFDRLHFITATALPLQQHFGTFVRAHALTLDENTVLNRNAGHIFSRDAIDLQSFSEKGTSDDGKIVALGKMLFAETKLSGNNSRSCASCHQPSKFFTDGLAKSATLNGKGFVKRNAPSLLYAAYQHIQFHDGRAGSLEEQIKIVLQNPEEMNANLDTVAAIINKDHNYRQMFHQVWPGKDEVDIDQVAAALAAYERTLAPFNSAFDRYIAGDRNALTAAQQKGFNLFMGKAMCGTCHFAPVFNGLLPPYYDVSEIEVLGVPANKNLRHARPDTDSGRYSFFPISFHNGAFKTTTVRNSARTAPYMHNGVFNKLEQVIEFYNKGGGNGLGLNIETQTLSDKELKLTKTEVRELKAFLLTLTDDLPAAP